VAAVAGLRALNSMTARIIAICFLALAGCTPPSAPPTVTATTTNCLVTQFGEHQSPDGIWCVSVPAAERPFELTRGMRITNSVGVFLTLKGGVTNTYSKENWRAQQGWFVFIEDTSQAWCYDGSNFLWMLHVDSDGSSSSHGPRSFPCPLPEQVYARLTDSAKKAIAQHDR
jgi:hypothetical protein